MVVVALVEVTALVVLAARAAEVLQGVEVGVTVVEVVEHGVWPRKTPRFFFCAAPVWLAPAAEAAATALVCT